MDQYVCILPVRNAAIMFKSLEPLGIGDFGHLPQSIYFDDGVAVRLFSRWEIKMGLVSDMPSSAGLNH